jgi:hypothetical protein
VIIVVGDSGNGDISSRAGVMVKGETVKGIGVSGKGETDSGIGVVGKGEIIGAPLLPLHFLHYHPHQDDI